MSEAVSEPWGGIGGLEHTMQTRKTFMSPAVLVAFLAVALFALLRLT